MPTDTLVLKYETNGADELQQSLLDSATAYQTAEDARSRFTEGLSRISEKTGAVAETLASFSDQIVQRGQDFTESENLVKESFGESLEAAQQWSEGLQQTLGLNGAEVRRNAAVFNVMFDSMKIAKDEAFDMSKGLTQLSYDMASFYNLSPDEAFEKLRAGITGEAEPLKALGVLLTEETVKQYAYANGVAAAGESLTEQQKVQARYGLILEQTSKAQGDMARTMDSGANISRRLEAQMETTQRIMGEGASDVRAKWESAFATMLQGLNESQPALLRLIGSGTEVGAVVGRVGSTALEVGSNVAEIWQMLRLRKIFATVATTANAAAVSAETAAVGVNTQAQVANAAAAGSAAAARSAGRFSGGPGGALGAVGMGLGIGALGYEAIRASGALDDENGESAGFMEAAGNATGRIGAFIMTGDTENYDRRVQGQMADDNIKAIQTKRAQAKVGDNGRVRVEIPPFELPSTRGDELADDAAAYGMDD